MQILTIKRIQAILLLAIVIFGYLWLNGSIRINQRGNPTAAVTGSVPAPSSDQKKIVLKNLGMA